MMGAKRPKLGVAFAEYIFLDVVGYSKRTIESQTSIIETLNGIVRGSVQKHRLGSESVLYVPTGDGICIALLNVGNPFDIQIQIALAILQRLSEHNLGAADAQSRFEVRIGINANKDNVVVDINGNPNVAGAGINEASRIMNKADGGQILVGHSIYETLKSRRRYISAFKHHPSVEVKHSVLLNIYQFVQGGLPFLNIAPPSFVADVRSPAWTRGDLKARGLKLTVEIGPSESEVRQATLGKTELKKCIRVMALIDTGASLTVINPQVAVTCGLRQVGTTRISTTGSLCQVPEYAGAISFPGSNLRGIDPMRLVACSMPTQDVACLIGRDVLERWRLTYDGRTGGVRIEE